YVFRRQMLGITFAPDTVGRLKLWDFIFYVTFGIAITFSVNLAGVLLIFSTLVIPAVIAFVYTPLFLPALLLAWGTGALALGRGRVASSAREWPRGPRRVVAFGVVRAVAAAWRRVFGAAMRGAWLAGPPADREPVQPAAGGM